MQGEYLTTAMRLGDAWVALTSRTHPMAVDMLPGWLCLRAQEHGAVTLLCVATRGLAKYLWGFRALVLDTLTQGLAQGEHCLRPCKPAWLMAKCTISLMVIKWGDSPTLTTGWEPGNGLCFSPLCPPTWPQFQVLVLVSVYFLPKSLNETCQIFL